MVANVEEMFSVKLTPWHNLGVVIHDAPSIEEGIKLAGADWQVDTQPLYLDSGAKVDSAKAVVRSTDKSVLGVVGKNYTPLQNVDAFNWFQPFIDSKECSLETAGSLSMGRKVWILAKINRPNAEIVKGDEVCKFLMLSNSHDGTQAVRAGLTGIRVVCANTLAEAHKSSASSLLRVRHTSKVKDNLDLVRETINAIDGQFEATAEQYRVLARKKINQADLKKYVKILIDCENDKDEDMSTRSLNIMKDIIGRCENGLGNNTPAVSGTWWATYNGYSEYLNYDYGRNANNRLDALWFGQSFNKNKKALDLALEMAV
jgi:phage/plasmid-like protein (TIGR03299 family)